MAAKLGHGEGKRQSWQEEGGADKSRGQDEREERAGEAEEGPAAKFTAISVLLGRRRQRVRGTGELLASWITGTQV